MDYTAIHAAIREGMNDCRQIRTELQTALRTVSELRAALQLKNTELNNLRPLVGLGQLHEHLLEDSDDKNGKMMSILLLPLATAAQIGEIHQQSTGTCLPDQTGLKEAPVWERPGPGYQTPENLLTIMGRTEFRSNAGFSSLFGRRAVPPGPLPVEDLPSLSASEEEVEEPEAAVARNSTDIPFESIQDPMDQVEPSMDLDITLLNLDCTFPDIQDPMDLPTEFETSLGSAPCQAPAEDEDGGPVRPRRIAEITQRRERAEREKRAREAEEDEPHQDQPPAKRQRRKRRTKMEGQLMRFTKKEIIAMYDEEQKELKRKDKALAAKERRINSWKEKHNQLKEENRQNRRRRNQN